jgi:RHS repeat-associated protein
MFGLINMGGRIYEPILGRFLSADIVIQDGSNSQSYNKYSYCLNNPLKYTDPSGYVSTGANNNSSVNSINHAGTNDSWDNVYGRGNYVFTGGYNSCKLGFNNGIAFASSGGSTTYFLPKDMEVAFNDALKESYNNNGETGRYFQIPGEMLYKVDAIRRKSGLTSYGDARCIWIPDGYSDPNWSLIGSNGYFKGPFAIEGVQDASLYPGIQVYRHCNWATQGFSAAPIGIFITDNNYKGIMLEDESYVQHEYGHYLQYKEVGAYDYYLKIAIPSAIDLFLHPKTHHIQPYEIDANRRSNAFFGGRSKMGNKSKDPEFFPIIP